MERKSNPVSFVKLTPSGSASTQFAGCTLSRSWVLCSSMGLTPISTRVLIMLASRDTTVSRLVCVDSSPEVVGNSRPARAVQESCGEHQISGSKK